MAEPSAEVGSASEDPEIALGTLLKQMAGGMVVMLVAIAFVAWALQDQVLLVSGWFVEHLGLPGLFAGVLFTDATFFTNEPLLLAAYAGGLGFWPVYLTASVASVLAGFVGYAFGAVLGRSGFVKRAFERNHVFHFMERYGFWFIVVAALTPFPYSVATWAAGATGTSLRTLLLGCLFRFPKTLFYLVLIVFGWDLGTSVLAR